MYCMVGQHEFFQADLDNWSWLHMDEWMHCCSLVTDVLHPAKLRVFSSCTMPYVVLKKAACGGISKFFISG